VENKFLIKLNIGMKPVFKCILYSKEMVNLFNFVHERVVKKD